MNKMLRIVRLFVVLFMVGVLPMSAQDGTCEFVTLTGLSSVSYSLDGDEFTQLNDVRVFWPVKINGAVPEILQREIARVITGDGSSTAEQVIDVACTKVVLAGAGDVRVVRGEAPKGEGVSQLRTYVKLLSTNGRIYNYGVTCFKFDAKEGVPETTFNTICYDAQAKKIVRLNDLTNNKKELLDEVLASYMIEQGYNTLDEMREGGEIDFAGSVLPEPEGIYIDEELHLVFGPHALLSALDHSTELTINTDVIKMENLASPYLKSLPVWGLENLDP